MENLLFVFATRIFRGIESYDSVMTEPRRVSSELPQLDRTDDPRGGSVAWALLAVTTVMIAGMLVTLAWFW